VAIFNVQAVQPAALVQAVQSRLVTLRNALDAATQLQGWASGVAVTDLEGIGFTASDAQALLSAIADANALAQIYLTGLPPSTYPQPASAYVYAASQRAIIGPA
jgi:hypothetical protein